MSQEDLEQEGMLGFWSKRHLFDQTRGDLGAFAYATGFREALNLLRKLLGRQGLDPSMDLRVAPGEGLHCDGIPEYDQREFLAEVSKGILGGLRKTKLPTKSSLALGLWLGGGLSLRSAATRVGVSEAAVSVMLSSARRKYLATASGRAAKLVA